MGHLVCLTVAISTPAVTSGLSCRHRLKTGSGSGPLSVIELAPRGVSLPPS
jgi:hypothetical protein